MRAVVHDRYGPPEVLRIEQVERPVPGRDEVLVRICATTVNRTDCHAVIDRRYPLERVADAARYVETQQKTGNVVLTVHGCRATEGTATRAEPRK